MGIISQQQTIFKLIYLLGGGVGTEYIFMNKYEYELYTILKKFKVLRFCYHR